MKSRLTIVIVSIFLFSCKAEEKETHSLIDKTVEKETKVNKADSLINAAILAHGGKRYETAAFSFILRGKEYQIKNNKAQFNYSVSFEDSLGNKIVDELTSDSFIRTTNGKITAITTKEESSYSQSLNSVVYFALLPYKLNDASVNKKHLEETTIKGTKYNVVQVTFKQEGGGEDHDDEYCYWISQVDNKIDYFAYNYRVNGGGARFRSAINRRVVDGITFQDYINWEASFETPLKDIPELYENQKLKEVSRIELEEIKGL